MPATCGFRRSRSLSVCVSHVLDFVVFSEKAFFWENSNRTTFFFPSSSAYKIWSATWLTRTGPFVCIEQKPTGARCAVTYMRHRAAESHYLRGLVIKGVASATNTLHVSGHQRFFFFFCGNFFWKWWSSISVKLWRVGRPLLLALPPNARISYI